MKRTGARALAFGGIAWLMLIQSVALASDQNSTGALADLTELPATQVENAEHSVQLAVARAGDRLVSVGEQGIVLLSDDDGRSWNQAAEVPVSVTLTDVEFVSPREGWAVGHSGVVLKTDSAGDRWTRVMTGEDVVRIIQRAVQALPEDSAGAQSAKRNAGYLTGSEPILDVQFSDTGEGWLMGAYGIALHTRDGGKTWDSAFSAMANPRSYHLYQLLSSPEGERLIVGERGLVARAEADSTQFETLNTGYDGTFFGGLAVDHDKYLLFGLRGNVRLGSGDHWASLDTGSETSFSSAAKTSAGIVLGDVSGRLFLKPAGSNQLRALAEASDAAITDLQTTPEGALVLSTARGLKRLNLDNTEFN